MHPRPYSNRQHQRGFTLMEILVAVAIFATVMIVALLLYDRSNRVFTEANDAAGVQQNTRVAFEKVASDLRMAGFDYKRAGTPTATTPAEWVAGRTYSTGTLVTPTAPNGHVYRCIDAGTSGAGEPAWTKGKGDIILDKPPVRWQEAGAPVYEQPDEQIEYSHTSAITIRANFDYNEPNTDNGRETTIETNTGGSFPVITTGNDEIVTYALVSKSGHKSSNADKIEFYADVNDGGGPKRQAFPGGAAERLITITPVDLTNAYPPYTLMRYTIKDNGEVQPTELADNIRSMTFTYWEDSAATRALTDLDNVAVTDLGGLGKYDPATPDLQVNERIIRGKIRAVTMNVVGMNPQPDDKYVHPTDAVAKNYRQYALQSTIVGRNLGLEGVPQSSSNPPGPPSITSSCSGYCGIALLSWKPDETTPGDVSYTILYDKSSSGSFSGVLPAGTQTSYAVDLTQALPDATKFYFKVAATNSNGTTVSKNSVEVDVRNATKPKPPVMTSVAGTGKPNELVVQWKPPAGNAGGTKSCTAGATGPENYSTEVKGYRLYRSMTAGFNLGDTGVVELMTENTGGATTDGSGTWSFVDNTVAACETYYYRAIAVEWCAAAAAYNSNANADTGMSDAAVQNFGNTVGVADPRSPQNLKFHPDSTCDADTNKCFPVMLTWDKVTQDVSGNTVNILDYEIRRQKKAAGIPIDSNEFAGTIENGVPSFSEPAALEYFDPATGVKFSYEYSVVAFIGYNNSAEKCNLDSDPTKLSFPDSCSTGATVKADMNTGSGTAADPWTDVTSIQVIGGAKPILTVEYSLDGSPFAPLAYPYLYPYDDLEDGEVHNIELRITVLGCTERITVYVQNDPPTCLLTGTVVSNSASTTVLDIDLRSSATEVITILGIDITWAGQSGLAWNSIVLPSGALTNAAGTPASPRTASFTPAGSDKTIAATGSYKIKMNFGPSGIALGSTVTGVTVRYTVPSTGTVVHNCTADLVRCSVTAKVAFVNSTTLSVTIENGSTEALDLQSFSIRWVDMNKLDWATITLPSTTTLPVKTATNGGTETFAPAVPDKTIAAGATYTVNMNFTSTFNNPPNVNASNVAAVQVNYKTPTSGTVTLSCRAE